MKQVTLMLMTLSLVIFLTGSFAEADKIVIVPVAPAYSPHWTAIPDLPGLEYTPNIGQDLFRHQGVFYNLQGGAWYRAPAVSGPWVAVQQPPQVFYNIQAPYFKAPPGWAKGKKTGWCGAPIDGDYIPPARVKRFYKQPEY